MSCENPTTDSDALMPRRRKYDKSKTCVKCKERRGNIVARHTVYCRQCFIPLTTHKFRRSLEPFVNAKPDGPRRTALKPTGNLLVAFSGGMGSSVLLDLVHRCYVRPDPMLVTSEGGTGNPRNERMWKQVTICYVEVCDAIPGTKDRTEEIRAVVSRLEGVEFLSLRVQDAFDRGWWEKVGVDPSSSDVMAEFSDESLPVASLISDISPLAALHSYLASLPTSTALPTALNTLIRLLLQYTAVQTGSSHLLLGTSLTSLAISLIASVAQGGGFHIKEETQEEWFPDRTRISIQPGNTGETKQHGVRIIRPLRDVGVKECGFWAWWMHLPILGRESRQWPGAKAGLGKLTNAFIVGLEKDYPSTVSTIVRTCGKLAPKGEAAGKCVLCERPIQSGVQDWKAKIAIRTAPDGSQPQNSARPDAIFLAPYLCYVCHTTFTSRGTRAPGVLYPDEHSTAPTSAPLPVWAASSVLPRLASQNSQCVEREDAESLPKSRKMERSEMLDAVKEFLLND